MSISAKSPEPAPTRRPISAVRISTVALIGIVAAVAIPAAAASVVMSGSLDQKQTTVQIQQPGPIAKVVIDDSNGGVRITADAAVTGVTGQADLNWHGSDQPPLRLDQTVKDGVLTLAKVCLGGNCGGASITIKVPPSVAVQAVTSNAGIDVSGVDGGVDLQTSNAGISADRLGGGDANMHTSNGGIDATFTGGPKSIRAVTSNAGVDITTDGKTLYYDDADTTNASRNLDNQMSRESSNVIYIRTTNGSIKIQ